MVSLRTESPLRPYVLEVYINLNTFCLILIKVNMKSFSFKLILAVIVPCITLVKAIDSVKSWNHLAISAHGRYLSRTVTKEPFFWQGDTAWEIFHRLNKTDVDLYLRDRADKGFNVIQAVIIPELNGTTHPNYYGYLPIENSDPTKPIEEYFQNVDYVVERAAELGIITALVPTWGRYVNCGWRGPPIIFNDQNARDFGRYIGNRYPGLPKLVGADSNGDWACNVQEAQEKYEENTNQDPFALLSEVFDTRSVWANMIDGLRESESNHGYDLFVTFHPTNSYLNISRLPLPYGSNYINSTFGQLSMNAVQSGHAIPSESTIKNKAVVGWDSRLNYENIEAMRDLFLDGPVIDLENHYEGANVGFESDKSFWNSSHVRHGLYNGFFAGACGITYGAHSIWQFYDTHSNLNNDNLYIEPQNELSKNSSWRSDLNFEGASQVTYLQNLFKNLPSDVYYSLEPDRTFIRSINNDEDILNYEGNRRISGLRSNNYYWIYIGYGDGFKLDLSSYSQDSSVSAKWYNPRDGKFNTEDEIKYTINDETKVKSIYPPTFGTIDDDFVLVVKVD